MCASVPWRSPILVIGRNTLRLAANLLKKLSFEQNQKVRKDDRSKLLISKELATDTFCSLVTGTPYTVIRQLDQTASVCSHAIA